MVGESSKRSHRTSCGVTIMDKLKGRETNIYDREKENGTCLQAVFQLSCQRGGAAG